MITIDGKYGTAKCYATNIEKSAIDQIAEMMDMPFTENANVAIMPDAHAGVGCVIGTTMKVKDKVCPNIVGVDIGCGILAVDLGSKEINLSEFDEACYKIPSGRNIWEGRKEKFDLTQLRCYRDLKDTRRFERSIGTLGGGNHFIEVDKDSSGHNVLVIHSGSRSLGQQVAKYYQNLAIQLHSGREDYFKEKQEIIDGYKKNGRRSEIQQALKNLSKSWNDKEHHLDTPKELCWLYGEYLDDYLHDVGICQEFAIRNRERMAIEIVNQMHLDIQDLWHTIHNYINLDDMVLRKGSISAKQGEKVIIPLNMRDGSIIATGRGNKDWNNSAPHGAGRVMSRHQARADLSLDRYKEEMSGIYTTCINEKTLDEAPDAYKSIDDIIQPVADSVDIVDIMKPIYNFKASN